MRASSVLLPRGGMTFASGAPPPMLVPLTQKLCTLYFEKGRGWEIAGRNHSSHSRLVHEAGPLTDGATGWFDLAASTHHSRSSPWTVISACA